MFGASKEKKFNERFLPNLTGEAHGVEISFLNFPIRVTESSPRQRVEYFRDFNERLIDAIWDEIRDFDAFIAKAVVEHVSFKLKIPGAPPLLLLIQVLEPKSKEQFALEMRDALANAIRKENIAAQSSEE
jgi:hypothetical protein